jgi:hypothetical protein
VEVGEKVQVPRAKDEQVQLLRFERNAWEKEETAADKA